MNKDLYVTWNGLLFTILFYFLLPMQSASAVLLEYSISGFAGAFDNNIEESLEITGTAFIDDKRNDIEELGCTTHGGICWPTFSVAYFEIYVGDALNFTGTSGQIEYNPADILSVLDGSGDWAQWRDAETNDGVNPYPSPVTDEYWLAFELPSTIHWLSTCADGCDALTEEAEPIRSLGFRLERISSVPIPSAVWLFGSGLIGLVGVARRKKA